MVDPYTATREEFTSDLIDRPIPNDATEDSRTTAQNLQDLLKKLASHPAMRPNLQQTYTMSILTGEASIVP